MSSIKKLFEQRWDFELYEVDHKKVITVIFFGQVDYPRSFYLEKEVEENGYESLKELSEKIRNHYDEFKHLEIVPPINL
ncbi:hypothetical protein [uncultured Chryseobacterium sp.]|jgi:hypothetical protein|uniref:hypothetical protein n=1 Tax=uncultured Chryseobacterium sp. TaxID=259322 RepID=UPI00260AB7DC|nr:hypothetical protein [uncultured Chryseobacterium sp.]